MYSSNQISQLINNQNAQFANQQVFSSNLSSSMGVPVPPMQALGFNYGGLHDPYGTQSAADFGNMGAGAISGLTKNLPGMVSGMAMGAGLLSMVGVGGKLTGTMSMMDPMTMAMSRGAAGAIRAAGAGEGVGFFGAAKHAFKGGPASALRFLRGGAMAAAPPLLAGMAAMEAANFVGSNLSAGAQQDAAMHATLRQNFDFYNSSSRSGRGFNVNQRDQISDSVRSIAEADPFAQIGELNRIMSSAAKGNLLHGATGAREFSEKFKKLTGTLKETAKILGTTMEGALSFFDASKSMGFYNKVDIIKNAQNALVGAGGGLTSRGIMQEQAMGSAQARAMGYSGAQGAILARKSVMGARNMFMAGHTSEEDMGEMTGGLRGEEAYKNLGRQMQGAAYSLAQSGIGRAMYAALSETTGEGANTRFTGRLDKNLLKQFRSGSLGASDIRRLASTKLSSASTDTKISFLNMEKDIAGSFAAGAGSEGWMGVINMIRERKPNLSDEKVKLLLKNMTGLGRRQIEYIMKAYEKQDETNQTQAEAATNLLRRRMEENELKMNHTFSGLMTQVGKSAAAWTSNPLQRAGVALSRGARDLGRSIYDSLFGRVRTASLGQNVLDQFRGMAMDNGGARLASESYTADAAKISNRGFFDPLAMRTGVVPRFLGTGGMQKVLADLGDIRDFARQKDTSDTNDGVILSRSGTGSMFSDSYSQKRLAFVQKTLLNAEHQSDKFFKDHAESLSTVSKGIDSLTAAQLYKIQDTTSSGFGSRSAYSNRMDRAADMLGNDKKHGSAFRAMTTKYARTLASRQGLNYDSLSLSERGSLEQLAQRAIVMHAEGKKGDLRMAIGEAQYQGMLDGDTVMTGQRLAEKRMSEESKMASEIGGEGYFVGKTVGGLVGGLFGTGGVDLFGRAAHWTEKKLRGDATENARRVLADDEQRGDYLTALGSESGLKKMRGKYQSGSDMDVLLRRAAGMSLKDRAKRLEKLSSGMETLRRLEGGNVLAQQFQNMGRELSGVSVGQLKELMGESGGASFEKLRELLTTSDVKNVGGRMAGITDAQANLAQGLAGLSGQKLAKARQVLGDTEAGRSALVNRRIYGKDMTDKLASVTGMGTDDEFIDKLKALGFGGAVSSEAGKKRLLEAKASGDVSQVQKALLVTGVGKKEDALQVLTLMRGGIEKMATTAEKLLDVMLTVHGGGDKSSLKDSKAKWDAQKDKNLWDKAASPSPVKGK